MTRKLPLEGIRVVELSHMVMGPTCGLILETRIPALPIQFGDDRLGLRLPLPKPGQDNEELIDGKID